MGSVRYAASATRKQTGRYRPLPAAPLLRAHPRRSRRSMLRSKRDVRSESWPPAAGGASRTTQSGGLDPQLTIHRVGRVSLSSNLLRQRMMLRRRRGARHPLTPDRASNRLEGAEPFPCAIQWRRELLGLQEAPGAPRHRALCRHKLHGRAIAAQGSKAACPAVFPLGRNEPETPKLTGTRRSEGACRRAALRLDPASADRSTRE